MARKQVEDCMFCDQPHTGLCGGTTAKKSSTPAPSSSPASKRAAPEEVGGESQKPADVAPQGRPRLFGADRVRPAGRPAPAPASAPQPVPVQARPSVLAGAERIRDKEDEQLARAITLFAERDMLHHETLTEHRDIILMPKSKIDAMIWKQVNKDAVDRAALKH